jgi:hypothetical protein
MRYSVAVRVFLLTIFICVDASLTQSINADDGEHLLTLDHYVSVRSTVPFMTGQITEIYVREGLRAAMVVVCSWSGHARGSRIRCALPRL